MPPQQQLHPKDAGQPPETDIRKLVDPDSAAEKSSDLSTMQQQQQQQLPADTATTAAANLLQDPLGLDDAAHTRAMLKAVPDTATAATTSREEKRAKSEELKVKLLEKKEKHAKQENVSKRWRNRPATQLQHLQTMLRALPS